MQYAVFVFVCDLCRVCACVVHVVHPFLKINEAGAQPGRIAKKTRVSTLYSTTPYLARLARVRGTQPPRATHTAPPPVWRGGGVGGSLYTLGLPVTGGTSPEHLW